MKTIFYFFTFLVLLLNHKSSESARILGVFLGPFKSHQIVFRTLTNELNRRGHELVVITTDVAYTDKERPANFTEIDLHDVSYNIKSDLSNLHEEKSTAKRLDRIFGFFNKLIDSQLKKKKVQNLINSAQKFDLVITSAMNSPGMIFSHFFKCPMIQFNSFGSLEYLEFTGIPMHPILYPTVIQDKINDLTNWDKIMLVKTHWEVRRVLQKWEQKDIEKIRKIFGPEIPSYDELRRNVDIVFMNTHRYWDNNRPVPPNVVYLGGLQLESAIEMEMPKDLKTYLDASKQGFIYLSFGTNVDPTAFSHKLKEMIFKVFSQLPYNIIVKWPQDALPKCPQNVKIFQWLPQVKLLQHPNIKLFINQGGLQSIDEAVHNAVPMLIIPIIADQRFNAEMAKKHGIGDGIDFNDLNEDNFRSGIEKIIGDNDKSYRRNMVRLRAVMADQPQSPLERAVWWTEHVLRHGGAAHLRAPAANLSWPEYLHLNLVFITGMCCLAILSTLGFILYFFIVLLKYYVCGKVKRD